MEKMTEIFAWDSEQDPIKIKLLVAEEIKKREEIEDRLCNLYKLALPLYANHEFCSIMVSKCNRAEVRFGQKPTYSEINILINALRVQMEILKEDNT